MTRPAPFRLKPPVVKLRENDVERQCLDLLHLRGYKHERNHAGTFKSADGVRWIKGAPKGTPDYITVHARYPGFYLEVKRPGGELSQEQEYKIIEIEHGWGIAVAVVESAAELAAWLDAHEERTREFWKRTLQIRGP